GQRRRAGGEHRQRIRRECDRAGTQEILHEIRQAVAVRIIGGGLCRSGGESLHVGVVSGKRAGIRKARSPVIVSAAVGCRVPQLTGKGGVGAAGEHAVCRRFGNRGRARCEHVLQGRVGGIEDERIDEVFAGGGRACREFR